MVADLGIGDQIDKVLQYADAAGGWTVVVFLGAWVLSKVFLIDILAIALAFSSGILFGGVFEGALISALGATMGSLSAFALSRTLLQERVDKALVKQPVARGLAKVVEEEGFKTVFVLRLSPILPIPTGSYPYIYGTSKLRPLTFAGAYFAGSLKPYLLDSYLGIFSKEIIDGQALDGSKDTLLLVGVGVLVLVGVFATELANESWDKVQAEVAADKAAAAETAALAAASGEALDPDDESAWDGMLGPLNITAFGERAGSLAPERLRDELEIVWAELGSWCDEQWPRALCRAVDERREERTRRERADALLAQLTSGADVRREAIEALSSQSLAAERAAEPSPSVADLATRTRMARWTLDADGFGREFLSATLFSFALLSAARRQWVGYPTSDEELDAAVAAQRALADAAAGATEDALRGAPVGASVGAPVEVSASSMVATPATPSAAPPTQLEVLPVDVETRTAEIAQRREEIKQRMAEIDVELQAVIEALAKL